TSSVAMGQPVIAFMEDEFNMTRKKATGILAIIVLVSVQFVIFFLKYGFLDEMDYWAGTFGLVLFALMETILFMWVFGADKAWREMNEGGDIKIPKIFFYIMKYLTPVVLFAIMVWWLIKDAIPTFFLEGVNPENIPFIWGARILMVIILAVIIYLVKIAWGKK
ncbi:MAG: sodium:calcium symporter, partial [Ignavibacteriales bacterium]